MKTDNNFVRSGRERIADDNYQTVDPRCVQALVETFPKILKVQTIMDACSVQGSGIVDEFLKLGEHAVTCADALSTDYYCDWDIFNPPYARNIVDHIIHTRINNLAMGRTRVGVAALLRTGFDHAKTRKTMFQDCGYYTGQLKMTFRPKWFLDTDTTPIHNYVWHIWTKETGDFGNPPQVWYW